MAGLLFVSQAMIDSWADQGRIDFVGNVMTLLSGEGRDRSYALEPAVRFLALLGADADPHRLLKKVKSLAQLRELGAEVVDASVVLGDVAYEVEPGFLAETSALQAAAAARTAPARAAPAPSPSPSPDPSPSPAPPAPSPPVVARPASGPLPANLEARRKEAEELARFLLDKLS
jgi:pyruvate/2-oxoglutarate dehydrogenase complex dihydrolipoamide acyltransferase (E2) component